MFNPLNLISSVKDAFIVVGVVAGLSLLGFLWWEKNSAEKEVLELQIKNSNLESAVIARQVEINVLNRTMETLQQTMKEIAAAKEVEDRVDEDIDNAPPDKDGPVSPVLRDTLDSLGRLYGHR